MGMKQDMRLLPVGLLAALGEMRVDQCPACGTRVYHDKDMNRKGLHLEVRVAREPIADPSSVPPGLIFEDKCTACGATWDAVYVFSKQTNVKVPR